MTFKDLYIGQKASVQKTFTAADVSMFAGISLDVNPLHMSDVYAEKSIFKKRVVHGILTSGLISAVLANKLPDRGRSISDRNSGLRLRFISATT